jgi:hypothetical protein
MAYLLHSMIYFTMLSSRQQSDEEHGEGFGSKLSYRNRGTVSASARGIEVNRQDNLCFDRDSNRVPPRYKSDRCR